MYKSICLALICVLIISCDRNVNNSDFQNPELSESGNYTFNKDVLFKFYEEFLEGEFGELNETHTIKNDRLGNSLYLYQSTVNNIVTGNLVCYPTSLGWNGFYADIQDLDFDLNGFPVNGKVTLRMMNGQILGSYYFDSSGKVKVSQAFTSTNSPNASDVYKQNGWWECTWNCFVTSKANCSADPDCDNLCDLVDIVSGIMGHPPQCSSAIMTACGSACIGGSSGVTVNPIYVLSSYFQMYGYSNGILNY